MKIKERLKKLWKTKCGLVILGGLIGSPFVLFYLCLGLCIGRLITPVPDSVPAPTTMPQPTATVTAELTATTVVEETAIPLLPPPTVYHTPTNTPVPTSTPTPTPTAMPIPTILPTPVPAPPTATAIPVVQPTQPPPAVCDCSGNIYNCPDFGTQAAAQACYDYCITQGRGDIHQLDKDKDGIVCESLP